MTSFLLSFNQHLLLPKTFQPFHAEDFTPFLYNGYAIENSIVEPPPLKQSAGNLTQTTTQQQQHNNKQNSAVPYKNSLFWCCFVAANGLPPFGEPPLPIELKMKEEMGVFFRKNARCLKDKRHRITLADMEEILTDLMTISTRPQEYNTSFGVLRTNLAVCIAYAIYWKINIYIACPARCIYTSFIYDEDDQTNPNNPKQFCSNNAGFCLLFLRGNSFELCDETEKLNKIKADYLELCHYKRPLHAVSYYKTMELQEIYERLNVSVGGDVPTKKADIYKAIENHCYTPIARK